MIKSMKWHIYQKDSSIPLCWGDEESDKVLEFDTYEDAKRFYDSAGLGEEAEITQDILYYDGGYLNATGKMIEYATDGNADPRLIDILERL